MISRRVREIVECSGGVSSRPSPGTPCPSPLRLPKIARCRSHEAKRYRLNARQFMGHRPYVDLVRG
jgi:hypothetical protein